MKPAIIRLPTLAFLMALVVTTLSSCDVIKGIFKAGFVSAFVLIFIVGLLILFLMRRFR